MQACTASTYCLTFHENCAVASGYISVPEGPRTMPQNLSYAYTVLAQTNGGSPVEAVSRGVGGLASPPLESRASTGGTDNGQHRHSIVAAMQAAQRANSQVRCHGARMFVN